MNDILEQFPILQEVSEGREVIWINPDLQAAQDGLSHCGLSLADIEEADERLRRFAPLLVHCFPETEPLHGIIESPLVEIPNMKRRLLGDEMTGKLLLKQDSHLAVAGSIKARGGIYEVLKYTEDLAIQHGLLRREDSYEVLAKHKEFFGQYLIQVGSTGNLGMSIGIMSAALGYQAVVHMSADARQWKKDLLRRHGVTVVEYQSDYSEAVKQGRKLSGEDPNSYFVDDENSQNLFLGYAVAALRLKEQLRRQNAAIDREHPAFVYLPCGVGGAPGGVTFGLKQVFGDAVHCFFVEPTQAPCMLAGMVTDLHQQICVQDIGLSGITHADGLAVGRPSGFVGNSIKPVLSGEVTVCDAVLYDYLRDLMDTEGIFLEPSACAAFHGAVQFAKAPEMKSYVQRYGLRDKLDDAVHIVWATGGNLVPDDIREEYLHTRL